MSLSNVIVKDDTYGITFKFMRGEDYDAYVQLYVDNEAGTGVCLNGTKVLLMYYYSALIGAFAMLGDGQLAHLLIDVKYRGRGFGTMLGALATFLTSKNSTPWTQYRDREVYAKLYAELGFRPAELIELEKGK